MGNWKIVIEGIGQHHNGDEKHDAEAIARDLVGCLKQEGRTVTAARIEYGNGNFDNLLDSAEPASGGIVPAPEPAPFVGERPSESPVQTSAPSVPEINFGNISPQDPA